MKLIKTCDVLHSPEGNVERRTGDSYRCGRPAVVTKWGVQMCADCSRAEEIADLILKRRREKAK